MPDQPTITCPRCGATSAHPVDVAEGYCDHCKDWTQPGAEVDRRLLEHARQVLDEDR